MGFKRLIWRLLGKTSEPVIVTFLSGPRQSCLDMLREVLSLVPDSQHYAVYSGLPPGDVEGVTFIPLEYARTFLKSARVGLAPVMFDGDPAWRSLRALAFRTAPHKLLAYNTRLERHHLRLTAPVAALLFLRDVPLDRIYLRPKWLAPWKKDRSATPSEFKSYEGRELSTGRPRVAVLSPYFPYPLSHGGAVRIYHLLREAAKHFDVFLFAFGNPEPAHIDAMKPFCARMVLVQNPRYREPRWSSLQPPEVHEWDVPIMRRAIEGAMREYAIKLLQVEYTQFACYGGDVLVEHDVTFDLYRQIHNRTAGISSWWNYWRWNRLERAAVKQFPRVVVMSEKDRGVLGISHARVIPNGVDLDRFQPEPEQPGYNVLFVGSFRHFPNAVAYSFLVEEIWPRVLAQLPEARLTVVGGPDADLYVRVERQPSVTVHGFVADVKPLYESANLVVVPTRVSAGTNLKVLEAMAMERAVVSTESGCAGMGMRHGETVHIAEDAATFAAACVALLRNETERRRLAVEARKHCELHFDWRQIGRIQRQLWEELLGLPEIEIRAALESDLPAIDAIQRTCTEAALWEPRSYLVYQTKVAACGDRIVGFLTTRNVAGETEILNLAVHPSARRKGVALRLLGTLGPGPAHLEVRASNLAAQSLYRAAGFEQVGTRAGYYQDPVEDAILYSRR